MDFDKYRTKTAAAANAAPAAAPNTLDPGGFLDGINGTKPFEYGNYFRLGTYNCTIKKCLKKTSQRGKGDLFIAEMVIEEVVKNIPDGVAVTGLADYAGASQKVGESCSMAQPTKNSQVAYPALAGFALAAARPADQAASQGIVDNLKAILLEAIGPDQPLAGETIQVEAVPHKTQAQKQIVRLIFHPWDGTKADGTKVGQ